MITIKISIKNSIGIQSFPTHCPILTNESTDILFDHLTLFFPKHITTVDPSLKRPISSPFFKNTLSFPMDGYTIAMDFPVNNKTLSLMSKLDEITSKYEGRIYLAKDSRMSKDTLLKTEKRLKSLNNFRKKIDTKRKFESSQSSRLGI